MSQDFDPSTPGFPGIPGIPGIPKPDHEELFEMAEVAGDCATRGIGGLFGESDTEPPAGLRYKCNVGPHDVDPEDVDERDAEGKPICPVHGVAMRVED
ncbi:MAG: hypothetical protein KJ638_07815 [Chloroflexi bacterium]|nr:hypothetical protein [Chloroflexota bacterium]